MAFINAGTKNADILREINFDKFIVSKAVILRENNLDYLKNARLSFQTLIVPKEKLYFSRFLPVKVVRVPAGFIFGFGFIGFWYFHDFSGSGLTGFIFKVRVFGFPGSRVSTNTRMGIIHKSKSI